jgi:hypothetical protein
MPVGSGTSTTACLLHPASSPKPPSTWLTHHPLLLPPRSLLLAPSQSHGLAEPTLVLFYFDKTQPNLHPATSIASTLIVMPGPWDAESDRKLLLRLVDPNLKAKWAEVASHMGPTFTSEAVR